MSKTTVALEDTVKEILAWKANDGELSPARIRRRIDLSFTKIMALIAPRIRHFIKQYGLAAHWEDAEQVCAIAVHRAIETYDPEKAQFTTFINWMIRGELQGLRFRLMTDQRPSARKVAATTVSLNALTQPTQEDGAAPEFLIEDEDALARTEASASDYLASSAMRSLMDSYVTHLRQVGIEQLSRRTRTTRASKAASNDDGRPRLKVNAIDADEVQQLHERIKRNHSLVASRLFELHGHEDAAPHDEDGITKERMRQITKRAAKAIASLTQSDPRFVIMADSVTPVRETAQSGPAMIDRPKAPANRPKRIPAEPKPQQDPAEWICETARRAIH
jgi:RNA polymerase sigma-32 factor